MTADEKRLAEIVQRALQKTKEDGLSWGPTKEKSTTNFWVQLGRLQLQVAKSDNGIYTVWLLDQEAKVVATLTTQLPVMIQLSGGVAAKWEKEVAELWDLARRQALQIDTTFDEALQALEDPGQGSG